MSTANGVLVPLCLLLFVTVVILLFYLFFGPQGRRTNRSVWRASARMSGRDTTDGDHDDGDLELGLDEATILSYPRLQYTQAEKDIDADDGWSGSCTICLLDYQDADTVMVLPECKHFFHVNCVRPWLKLHSTCPICRKRMITASKMSGRRY